MQAVCKLIELCTYTTALGQTSNIPYGYDCASGIWYIVDWDNWNVTLYPMGLTLSITLYDMFPGEFTVDHLYGCKGFQYLFNTYLILYTFWGYPIHRDRIDQKRGQKTTGVAERGNRDKRVCHTCTSATITSLTDVTDLLFHVL